MRYELVVYDDKSNDDLTDDENLKTVMIELRDLLRSRDFELESLNIRNFGWQPAFTREDVRRENGRVSQDTDAI